MLMSPCQQQPNNTRLCDYRFHLSLFATEFYLSWLYLICLLTSAPFSSPIGFFLRPGPYFAIVALLPVDVGTHQHPIRFSVASLLLFLFNLIPGDGDPYR